MEFRAYEVQLYVIYVVHRFKDKFPVVCHSGQIRHQHLFCIIYYNCCEFCHSLEFINDFAHQKVISRTVYFQRGIKWNAELRMISPNSRKSRLLGSDSLGKNSQIAKILNMAFWIPKSQNPGYQIPLNIHLNQPKFALPLHLFWKASVCLECRRVLLAITVLE